MKYLDPIHRPRYLNTGKVRIGIAHVPKARALNRDEERIQAGLISKHEPRTTARDPDDMVLYSCVVTLGALILIFVI